MTTPSQKGLEEILRELGIDDPKAIALAKQMDKKCGKVEKSVIETECLTRMKREIVHLYQTIKTLSQLNQDFAAAVGACPYCWGQDAGCIHCEGYGAPGSKPIDPDSYQFFIAPVIEKITS